MKTQNPKITNRFISTTRWIMNLIQFNPTHLKRTTALAVAFLAMLVTARGQLYVTSENGFAGDASLGAYNLNGSAINASLIPEGGGLYLPVGMAITGSSLYMSGGGGANSVGQYTTSGGTVNGTLINGLSGPSGIATDGSYVYVVNSVGGTIGKYTTSGGMVNASLISQLTSAGALAISGNELFLGYTNHNIGVFTTSGATVSQFLLGGFTGGIQSIAINGSDLFVASGNGTIGEYTTSGGVLNASLITGLTEGAYGMASIGNQLFVTQYGNAQLNAGSGSVYEYTLGSTPGTVTSSDTSFITGLYEPHDIVVATPEPSTWALLAVGLVALVSGCRRVSRA
jgi:hypothetical protein